MNDQSQDYGYPPSGDAFRPPAAPSGFDAGYGYPPPTQEQPMNPTPAAGNPEWNQPAWGQPTWGSQPVSDWPQSTAYDQDHGYPTSDDPNQGYPLSQYAEWANVSLPAAPQGPGLRPSNRGTVALALVLAALGISLVLSVWGGRALAEAITLSGGDYDPNNSSPAADAAAETFGWTMLGQVIPSLLGLAALIVGITGLKTTSRGVSIAAIVIAILAPLVSLLVFTVVGVSGSM